MSIENDHEPGSLVQVAGHTVPSRAYSLYRTLGVDLLTDLSWYAEFKVVGVALSKVGVTIFVEGSMPLLSEKLKEFSGEDLLIRAIGPVLNVACGGDSTGAGSGRYSSGTFGCLVQDTKKLYFGLSCDHVVGTTAGQAVGDAVWCPGKARGGTPTSLIGQFKRGSAIVLSTSASNRVDGALIELVAPSAHTQSINGLPAAPSGVNRSISFGDMLKKSGVNTGVTTGQFTYIVTMNVPYMGGQARFVDQITIDGGGVLFADRGDSGAVVLDASDRVAGLLFCAAPQSYLGFANYIDDVETELGVTVV